MSNHLSRMVTSPISVEVAPNDAADIVSGKTALGLYIGVGGTLRYNDAAGNTINTIVSPGPFPFQVKRVHDTGTDATNIVAGFLKDR